MSRLCECFKSKTDRPDAIEDAIVPLARIADLASFRSYKLAEHEGSFAASNVRFFAEDSGHTVTISFEDGLNGRLKMRLVIDGKPVHTVETAVEPKGTECVRVVGKLVDFTCDLNEMTPKCGFQTLKLKSGELDIEYYKVLLE